MLHGARRVRGSFSVLGHRPLTVEITGSNPLQCTNIPVLSKCAFEWILHNKLMATMYRRPQFREDRPDVLVAAMRQLRFCTLVSFTGKQLLATHLPILVNQNGAAITLEMHVARANTQWKEVDLAVDALAIFTGPNSYVSPTWYPSKEEHQRVVPTWNYISVQASGALSIHDDVELVLRHVRKLTDHNETGRNTPWTIDDAPADFIQTQCRAIVGLSLEVRQLEGSWKMAQHRSEADRLGVMEGLMSENKRTAAEVADEMKSLENQPII